MAATVIVNVATTLLLVAATCTSPLSDEERWTETVAKPFLLRRRRIGQRAAISLMAGRTENSATLLLVTAKSRSGWDS